MNFGIDLRPLVAGQSGGIVRVVEELFPALFAVGGAHRFAALHGPGYRLPGPLPAHVEQIELGPDPADLDACLVRHDVTALLRSYPTDELLAFPAEHEVTFVPDAQHADLPEFFTPEVIVSRTRAFARAADGTLAVLSNHTRERLAARFPHARPAVVVPPAPPRLHLLPAEPPGVALPAERFFLYPARGWPHKNHSGLLRAWRAFRRANPYFALVLTGTGGCVPELLAGAGDSSVHDLGHVPDAVLARLYRRAVGLVFPSLYEGYGLPILEAFAFGLPVVCGAHTSLVEVGGDAVFSVDPTDADALARALDRIANDAALRADLTARGRARLPERDATASALVLLGALERAAAEPVPPAQAASGAKLWHERLAVSEADRAARLAVLVRQHEAACQQQELLRAQDAELNRLARHEAYERLLADAPPGPLVSVVVAMGDHRGSPDRCVRAWTQEQTFPRDRIEVIVAFDGKDRAALERVKRVLGPGDRVIDANPDSETAQWATGARRARGRWLYFAEAHSYGEPECLEQMIRYLLVSGKPGASSRSLDEGEAFTARLEGHLFQRVSAARLTDDHWSKLFLRGAAIERDVYFRAGGLRGEYGLFAEPLFAATLHRAGHRLGHARASVVRHQNAISFAHLAEHIGDYAAHECAFRLDDPDPVWDEYFGAPPEWTAGGRTDPALARAEARVRLRNLLGGRGSFWQLAKFLPVCVLGGGRWRWPAALGRLCRRLRVCSMRAGEARLDQFAAWWTATAAGARLDFATRIGEHTFQPAFGADIDELPAPLLVGFHPLERYVGLPFRWSEPLAHLKLALPPGEDVIELRTRELRPPLELTAFVNGRSAAVEDRTAEEGRVRVTVPAGARRAGLQYLTLTCAPWRVPGDPRALGLPLFGLGRAAETGACRAA